MSEAYSESAWRNRAMPIIAAVLREYPDDSPERRKALRDAYPFGERKFHPYKIWLSEVKRQTAKGAPKFDGKKPIFGSRRNPFGGAA